MNDKDRERFRLIDTSLSALGKKLGAAGVFVLAAFASPDGEGEAQVRCYSGIGGCTAFLESVPELLREAATEKEKGHGIHAKDFACGELKEGGEKQTMPPDISKLLEGLFSPGPERAN